MDSAKRKALKDSYKNKETIGGIYCIICRSSGEIKRQWILSSVDMESTKKRFEFALQIKSTPDPSMRREWEEYGSESFSFVLLEEMKKTELQTAREFAADIKTLLEMWLEKAEAGEFDINDYL